MAEMNFQTHSNGYFASVSSN
ncbi:hypothetical protein [Robinsoniella peoriensis]